MPRIPRVDIGGRAYHVINRAVGRLQIFTTPEDYLDFLDVVKRAQEIVPIKIYAYCIMPNHWHFLVRTERDGDLGVFMHALANTHTRRVHAKTKTVGSGPLYQGRYKGFLVDSDEYFVTVLQYVERNAMRARLAALATEWRWGSAWVKVHGSDEQKKFLTPVEWLTFSDYASWINSRDDDAELLKLRHSIKKSLPYGRLSWVEQMVRDHGLEASMRTAGRPAQITTHIMERKRDCPD